jgi:peptidoglycan/LPS O-acetylase OafA/YrhL
LHSFSFLLFTVIITEWISCRFILTDISGSTTSAFSVTSACLFSFLLSAFLITELLFRENDRVGTIHVRAFYMRRILRIWPLYFAAFFGLVLLGHFLRGASRKDPASWLAFTFFAGNWYICRYGWIPAYPVNPLWSISVEEQFYIAIPIQASYGRRRVVKAVALVLIAVAYVLIIAYGRHPRHGFSSQWTNSFVQFQFFSAGALLSLYLNGRVPRWPVAVRLAAPEQRLAAGSSPQWSWAFRPIRRTLQRSERPLAGRYCWREPCSCFSAYSGSRPSIPKHLVYLGRISYGLYVFHELIYFLIFKTFRVRLSQLSDALHLSNWRGGIGTVLALGLTILLAHLSYPFYERPFLSLKKHFTFVPSRD